MKTFNDKQRLGSETAKGGFKNEANIVNKFNCYATDIKAQEWLKIMGYDYTAIISLQALQIPTRLKKTAGYQFGFSDEKFAHTQKFKKADVQIQVTITTEDGIIHRENISIKKADSTANFNQIDKRPVDTYQEMWSFDNEIAETLKKFTGEIKPTESESINLRDKRRWYLDELPQDKVQKLLHFFEQNKHLILNDIIRGRGTLSAEWFLVTKKSPTGQCEWIFKNINDVINFYAQGNIAISPRGSLILGKLTAQRKGGTPDPTSLQFKMKPLDLFELK